MRKTFIFVALFVVLGVANLWAQSADIGIKATLAAGEVTSVVAGKIVLQTKDGAIEVVLSDKTEYKRIPPENPILPAAVVSKFDEIGVGDKLLVTGKVSDDKKTIPAKAVYLLTKSDIAQKQTNEREEWKTRGISGQIKAINPQTKEITVLVRSVVGSKDVLVSPKDNAKFLRYAPDSVDYNEAVASSFSGIKVGDSLRALGDKNADGSTFSAEKLVSGAFQTVAGTITAIDTAKNEITINNIKTKKDVTIAVGKNSVLKQFPVEMAQRMAQFQMAQASGIQPGGQGGGTRPPQGNQPGDGQGGGAGFRGGGGSIDDLLERFPNISLADLKVGEMIAVSSTKGANAVPIVGVNAVRITAIKLLSGVEPFLKAQQSSTGGNRRNGQGGQDSGFSIPGLEGAGFP